MAINIMTAFNKVPPPLDFVWSGFLLGTVGALIAPGSTGKSFWALEAAMSVACNSVGGDLLNLKPPVTGRVVYIAAEDPELALIHRIHAIGHHLPLQARQAIAENLTIESIMGKRLNIMDAQCIAWITSLCTKVRLIVLDTLSRMHNLEENSNSNMAQLITTIEYIASNTGASILYIHHVSKGSVRDSLMDKQQAARGASALIDNARWCGFVAKMTEDEANHLSKGTNKQPISNTNRNYFVRFGISKQNYSTIPIDQWYERKEGGVLLPVELVDINNETIKKGANRDQV